VSDSELVDCRHCDGNGFCSNIRVYRDNDGAEPWADIGCVSCLREIGVDIEGMGTSNEVYEKRNAYFVVCSVCSGRGQIRM